MLAIHLGIFVKISKTKSINGRKFPYNFGVPYIAAFPTVPANVTGLLAYTVSYFIPMLS